MTKEEYLKELSHYLRRLPEGDYQEAMDYFQELLDDSDDPTVLMMEWGSPKEAAHEVIHQLIQENLTNPKEGMQLQRWLRLLLVLLFSASMGITVFLFVVIPLLCMLLFCIAAYVTILVMALAALVIGCTLFWDAVTAFSDSWVVAIITLGGTFITLGAAGVSIALVHWFARFVIRCLIKLFRLVLKRGGRHE